METFSRVNRLHMCAVFHLSIVYIPHCMKFMGDGSWRPSTESTGYTCVPYK